MAISKRQAQALRELLRGTLEILSEGGQWTFDIGTIKYGEVAKVVLVCTPAGGPSIEEADYRRLCYSWGLKPDDLGREFRVNGTSYVLVGARPSARRYPLLGKRGDGKRFKFPVGTVRSSIVRPTPFEGVYQQGGI